MSLPTRGELARIYDEIAVEYDRIRTRPWPEVLEDAAVEGEREAHPAGSGPGDVWVPWRAGGKEVLRFYHLFADGELPRLAADAGLRVGKYFRSGDNYMAVVERRG